MRGKRWRRVRIVTGWRLCCTQLRVRHVERLGTASDLLVGLQLTHSGRFCRPHGPRSEPVIAYHHPLLDPLVGVDVRDDRAIIGDEAVEQVIDAYVMAAGVAAAVGFQFVDIKACHGYLLHEFLERTRGPENMAAISPDERDC